MEVLNVLMAVFVGAIAGVGLADLTVCLVNGCKKKSKKELL